jgi:hypothetical protein
MSEAAGVALMMNNYFHDVATALLLASGIVMWMVYNKLSSNPGSDERQYFLRLYDGITKLARFSLAWIILGGIPRTYFYTEFEWSHYAGKSQIPALIVKHVLAFIFVGGGAYIWLKIKKKVDRFRSSKA